MLTDSTGLGKTGEIYLVNKDGYLLSPSRFTDDVILETKINTKQVNLFLSEYLIKGHSENIEQKPIDYPDYRGEKVLGVHFYIPEMQWGLIAEFDIKEVYKPINEQTILFIFIFSVLLLAVLFFAFKISRDITLPIIKLHEGTEEIIKGNLEHKIGIKSKDEIGELSHSFDIMTGKLKKAQNKIDRHTETLETTVKERTTELGKQFEKSEKQRIATLVVMNDLNKNTKELKEEIIERKRAEQIQKVLYNISNAVITTDNLDELISLIRKELGTIINTTNFYIALYDKKTDIISLPFDVDEKDDYETFPAGKTLTAYVIKTGKSLLVDNKLLTKLIKDGKVEDIGSPSEIWLGVPLKIEGKVTGALAVQSYTDENAYNESDMEMIEFVSDQVSISIDRKKAEDNLITALKKAEESDRLKTSFLHNMSHEIRTPMNGILGFTNLLLEPGLTGEEQHNYIDVIKVSGDRMLNTINDLLNISLIESNQVKIAVSEVNVNEQNKNLYTFFKPEAEKKGIQLSYKNTLPEHEAIIKTDSVKIYAILSNLIKNAIKYSDEGTIEFGYKKKEKNLEFFVKDTGIGIPKDRQQAIFDRFVQADIEDIRAYEGSGLGLSISKAYVKMLGGKIWVESREGKGSQFYFTIPYNTKREEKTITINKTSMKKNENQIIGLKVLIAEDIESADMYLTLILKNFSKEILHAKTGTKAIDICRNNPDIDLILMDIKMPKMNGYEATRKIREFNKDVIIIAQTAYALAGDREKSIVAGCDDYISKPINKEMLLEKIEKYFVVNDKLKE